MTAATASAGATASSVESGSEELKQTAAEPGSAGTEVSVDLGREPRPAEGEAASKEGVKGEVEEEEEEECGFCKWMKAGGCREVFIAWEQCVESNRKEGDSSYTETCLPQTLALRECMAEHRSYYAPLLEAEEAEEAAQKGEAQDSGAAPPPPPQQQQDNSNQAGGS